MSLNEVLKEMNEWLQGDPDSDRAFEWIWKVNSAWKAENKSENYCLYIKSYHYDEEDRFLKLSKNDYQALLPHKDELIRGNYCSTTEDILERVLENSNDYILESQMNWDKYIELASC